MHTLASTMGLVAGDSIIGLGNRIVSSVERNMNNLDAALIRFTDGTFFHAGVRDCHAVTR